MNRLIKSSNDQPDPETEAMRKRVRDEVDKILEPIRVAIHNALCHRIKEIIGHWASREECLEHRTDCYFPPDMLEPGRVILRAWKWDGKVILKVCVERSDDIRNVRIMNVYPRTALFLPMSMKMDLPKEMGDNVESDWEKCIEEALGLTPEAEKQKEIFRRVMGWKN
jgi:hypothetical protein